MTTTALCGARREPPAPAAASDAPCASPSVHPSVLTENRRSHLPPPPGPILSPPGRGTASTERGLVASAPPPHAGPGPATPASREQDRPPRDGGLGDGPGPGHAALRRRQASATPSQVALGRRSRCLWKQRSHVYAAIFSCARVLCDTSGNSRWPLNLGARPSSPEQSSHRVVAEPPGGRGRPGFQNRVTGGGKTGQGHGSPRGPGFRFAGSARPPESLSV